MILLYKSKQKGFTLIEVLVAVLVFSFGLLGIAGMMTISVRNNHNGYLRSQANFLAENMIERMSANPFGLWSGRYDGDAAIGTADCTLASPCDYLELADFDRQQWAQSLQVSLPNGAGNILCVANSLIGDVGLADPPSIWVPASPYDGICTVTVTWNESNRNGTDDTQTMVLVGQP